MCVCGHYKYLCVHVNFEMCINLLYINVSKADWILGSNMHMPIYSVEKVHRFNFWLDHNSFFFQQKCSFGIKKINSTTIEKKNNTKTFMHWKKKNYIQQKKIFFVQQRERFKWWWWKQKKSENKNENFASRKKKSRPLLDQNRSKTKCNKNNSLRNNLKTTRPQFFMRHSLFSMVLYTECMCVRFFAFSILLYILHVPSLSRSSVFIFYKCLMNTGE